MKMITTKVPFLSVLASSALLLCTTVWGAEQRSFDIPSTEAVNAIPEFARQAGVQIVAPADQLKGIKTIALRGEFDTRAALQRLLIGTGLEVASDDGIIITLKRTQSYSSALERKNQVQLVRAADETTLDQSLRLAQTETSAASQKKGSEGSGSRTNDTTTTSDQAGDVDKAIPEILVQGSKMLNMDIKRSADDAQPYVVFEREKIEQSGATNLENFLRERLPMNAAGLENSQRVTQLGSRSSINLRGLGATQTLILIDGHRTVNGPAFGGSPQQPDLNGIPLSSVERIEVLPATSSGIYGGNATGGVINIITRQDYSGVELKAIYGNTFNGDAAQKRFEMGGGTDLEGGKTRLTFAGSYADEDAIALGDRRSLVERYYDNARTNAPSNIFPPGSPPLGATPNIRSANGSNLVLKSNNTALNSSYTFVPAGYAGITDGGNALVANAGQYNFALPNAHQFFTGGRNQLGQDTETKAIRATLQREFGENVRVFLEGNYSDIDTNGRTSGITNGTPLAPYTISAGAPTNPFTTDILVTLPTDSLASYISTATTRTRAIAGIIIGLPRDWKAEADYTWARDRSASNIGSLFTTGNDIVDILTGAVDVLRDPAVNPVNLSPYLADPASITPQKITLNDVAVRLSGPLFNMPAGPVMLSSLLEYREEKFSETLQVIPSLFTFFYPDRSARTYSAYVESQVPLLKNLDLQLAGRFDKYRTLGKTGFVIQGFGMPIEIGENTTNSVNPTVALRYQPIADLALRASYGTGFVAPDASQLAPSQNLLFEALTDPKRGNTAVNPTGVIVSQGGNPDLDPEESKNLSFGFIFTPQWAQGLRFSADYTRIKKTQNISFYPTGLQGLLNDENLFSSRIVRGANLPGDQPGWAGPITLINASLFNISESEVEAIDVQLDYSWTTTTAGDFALSAVASKQLHLKTQSLEGQPVLDLVGLGFRNPQELNGNVQLNWRRNAWSAGWSARYYDSYNVADPALGIGAAAIALQGNGGRVDNQTYHDVYMSYSFGAESQALLENTELRLGVRNVFDELPPFDAGLFLLMREFYSPLGDALKRTYDLSISKQF